MQYMKLTAEERDGLLAALADMPGKLEREFAPLSPTERRQRGPADAFSPLEHVWHLADLEVEGFGIRIRRLLAEHDPRLPDFDGAAVARERDYRSLSFAEGLARFAAARRANLEALRSVPPSAWSNSGWQEGVGMVSLCDMPSFLKQHDDAHRAEIRDWQAARRG